jgi:hypothetical protein
MEGPHGCKNNLFIFLVLFIIILISINVVPLFNGDCSLFFSLSLQEEKKKKAKPLKTPVETTLYQKQVIAGLLFSDGHLRKFYKSKSGNYRLEFTFKIAVLDYCHWIKFALLSTLCTESKTTPYPKQNPTQVWFSTRYHKYFTEIYNNWYKETEKGKVKVIPSNNYLECFFNEVSLAHTIMGDGYWHKSWKTVIICTESFSHADVSRFILFLESRFGLKAKLSKRVNNYRIAFHSEKTNISLLRKLVLPFMHECMLYKLGINIDRPGKIQRELMKESIDLTKI